MALRTPPRPVDLHALERRRVDLVRLQQRPVDLDRHAAVGAEPPVEALRLREDERAREHERLDPHVEEARHHAARVVRVQSREHQVTRQGRLHRDVRRLAVADLADEHDVRVLAQHRAQDAGERQALGDVDVALVHAGELVFHRVLGRHDVDVALVQVLQARVERRRLARAGRAGDEDDAVRLVDRELHRLVGVFVQSERGQPRGQVRLVEDAHHHLLAVHRRQDRHADVDLLLQRLDLEAPVLGTPPLGDVEVGHDLDARDDRAVQGLRRRRTLHQGPVDAVPEARGLLQGLEVDVGRLRLQGLDHHRVHHPDDRGLARRVDRGVDLVRALAVDGRHLDLGFLSAHDVLEGEGGVGGVLLGLDAGEGVGDLALGGDDAPEAAAGDAADLLAGGQVERVGEGDGEARVGLAEREGLGLRPELDAASAEERLVRHEGARHGHRGHGEVVGRREDALGRVGDRLDLRDRAPFRGVPRRPDDVK